MSGAQRSERAGVRYGSKKFKMIRVVVRVLVVEVLSRGLKFL